MQSPPTKTCFHCGTGLARGGPAFRLRVEMAADFDGYIDADRLGDVEEASFGSMTAGAERTAEELAEQVYRERILLLCPQCAGRIWDLVTSPAPDAS